MAFKFQRFLAICLAALMVGFGLTEVAKADEWGEEMAAAGFTLEEIEYLRTEPEPTAKEEEEVEREALAYEHEQEALPVSNVPDQGNLSPYRVQAPVQVHPSTNTTSNPKKQTVHSRKSCTMGKGRSTKGRAKRWLIQMHRKQRRISACQTPFRRVGDRKRVAR